MYVYLRLCSEYAVGWEIDKVYCDSWQRKQILLRSKSSRPSLEPNQILFNERFMSLLRRKSGWSVKLTTHRNLTVSLEMNEALIPVSISSHFVHTDKFNFSHWLDQKLYVSRFILKYMNKAEITSYTYAGVN